MRRTKRYSSILPMCRGEHSVYMYIRGYDRIIINGDKYLTKDAKIAWLCPIYMKRANPAVGTEGYVLRRMARPPRTINDIGPWFSRRYDGTIAGFCPVCPLLLLPRLLLPSSTTRPYPPRLHVLFLLLLLFPPPFLPSSERRQVGVRAAVNSPAPLSALMSLLLFALLNAIRAYSVSLPPLLGPRATTSSFRLPRANVVVHARTRSHTRARTRARARARSSILAATLSRSRGSATGTRTRTQHGRARNARYRAEGTAGA